MKLSRHAFVRFWDVHAWLGVMGGLVLHVMFFAGGFALFFDELCGWQEPEIAAAPPTVPIGPLVERVLGARGVHPSSIDVSLPGPHRRVVEIGWTAGVSGERGQARVVVATGAEVSETSHLGRILFWLHFLYHPRAPWGTYAAGVFGAALFLAIVTGVLIQLKDLRRQLHQFRPRKSVRLLWSDLHKVLGVMGLPFQTMYALTGALIGLGPLLVLAFAGPMFGGDQGAAARSWRGEREAIGLSGRRAPALTIDALTARARSIVPGFEPEFVRLESVNDASMTASFWGAGKGHLFGRGDVVLRGSDGTLLADAVNVPPTPGAAVNRWATGLHYVWFGGLVAKVLYAVLAAATCLTILSGNWIWLARRESAVSSAGNRLLARLTIGIGGGVVVASAALFWANRLVPPSMRMAIETWSFFGVWSMAAILFLVRAEARAGWVGLLGLSGAAFVAVPMLTLLRFGVTSPNGALSGVDAGAWLLGAALLATALIAERRMASVAVGRRSDRQLSATVTAR